MTVRAKILLRKIWGLEPKVDWDDSLPDNIREAWRELFIDLEGVYKLKFNRALTPEDAVEEDPTLVIFSDGSSDAYGAVAYCRWKTNDGYASRLIIIK